MKNDQDPKGIIEVVTYKCQIKTVYSCYRCACNETDAWCTAACCLCDKCETNITALMMMIFCNLKKSLYYYYFSILLT